MNDIVTLVRDSSNVKSVKYEKDTDSWVVEFFNGNPTTVSNDLIIDFLMNG